MRFPCLSTAGARWRGFRSLLFPVGLAPAVAVLRYVCLVVLLPLSTPFGASGQTPPDFKIAFIGDQGMGADSQAVLNLIQAEGAQAVVHSGDFDYGDDPEAWDQQIDAILGPQFPYFASVGNHDDDVFYGSGGYQEKLAARLGRLGIPWDGDLGVQSNLVYQGVHIVLVAPGVSGSGHDTYIRDVFASSASVWRVSSFHKNMHLMQPEGKDDDTGWGVYEESRRAGAIIATGHAHAYSRTHLLSSMSQQQVLSSNSFFQLAADDPATSEDDGASFAFVSGLGGKGTRPQEVWGDWFACIYTETQNAEYGALFGQFHYAGIPSMARFYFKTITGEIIDEFWVQTLVNPGPSATGPSASGGSLRLQALPVGPGGVVVMYTLDLPEPASLSVFDVRGRLVQVAFRSLPHSPGTHRWEWRSGSQSSGVYFLHLRTPSGAASARFVLIH